MIWVTCVYELNRNTLWQMSCWWYWQSAIGNSEESGLAYIVESRSIQMGGDNWKMNEISLVEDREI